MIRVAVIGDTKTGWNTHYPAIDNANKFIKDNKIGKEDILKIDLEMRGENQVTIIYWED